MTLHTTAKNEVRYLRSSGFLSLAIGLFFLADALGAALFPEDAAMSSLNITFHVVEFTFLIFMLYVLFKNLKSFNTIPSRTAWLGRFDDEFLNFTNMKGYQYAFNLAALVLFASMFASDIWPEEAARIDLHIFCKSVFAVSLLAYSLPVLVALYREND